MLNNNLLILRFQIVNFVILQFYFMKYFIFVFIITLCYSCANDECSGKEYLEFNQVVIDAIPYVNGQQIEFVTNEGESFLLTVEGEKELWTGDNQCIENLTQQLIETGNQFSVMTIIHRGTREIMDFIQISISSNRNNRKNTLQVQINQDGSMEAKIFATRPITFQNHQVIEINNATYSNVLQINYGDIIDPEDISKLMYSKEKGVIQYETMGGLVTSLNE